MQPDTAKYRHHLDGFDLTEGQKAEIVQAVHAIMEGFVDLAFGTDATQLSIRAKCLGIDRERRVGVSSDSLGRSRSYAYYLCAQKACPDYGKVHKARSG